MEYGTRPFSSQERKFAAQGESSSTEPRTVEGQVKWFDFAKGYGFVAPFDGSPDILLHQACVRQSGVRTVKEGATLVCEVVRGPRGLQASRLISIDNSTANAMPGSVRARPARDCDAPRGLAGRPGQMVQPSQGLWLPVAGSGHARHFCPYGDVEAGGPAELREGQQVRFRLGDGPKGELAAEVETAG